MALIGHWPLVDDINDYSGNNYHLTNRGGVLSSNGGKLGKCYIFDGDNAKCLHYDNFLELDNIFSWSIWFYQTDNTTSQFIMSHGRDVSNFGINIAAVSNNRLRILVGTNSIYYNHTMLNKWTHIAITCDGNDILLYVDGDVVSNFKKTEILFTQATNKALVFGKMSYGYTNTANYFPTHGMINDARIYSHTLTDIEIKELYNLKIIHYDMNKTPLTYENLIKDQTRIGIYNNYKIPATIIRLEDETLFDNPIYKITFTPETEEQAINLRNKSLGNKGVHFNVRTTFKANTKYNYSIYFKRITESINSFGGTASNMGGWKCKDDKIVDNGWYRSNQYRDSNVSEEKQDNIFTSMCDPHAEVGRKTEFLVSSQMLVEGTTQRLDFINDTHAGYFEDISGFNNHSNNIDNIKNIKFEYMTDDKYPYLDIKNNGGVLFTAKNPLFGQTNKQEFTLSAWVNISSCEGNLQFVNMNSGVYFSYATRHKALMYLNSGANDYYMYSSYIDKYINTWTHFTFRFKNNGVDVRDVFINGKKCNSEGPNRTNTPSGLNQVLSFFNLFNGKVSDIRMYATSIDDESIERIYRERSSNYGDKINRYLKLENGANKEFVKLLKDRDYYKKIRINLPRYSEFYIENDLTDRVGGKIPTDYENCNSLNGYTKGGSKLCVQKKHDGLIIARRYGNIVGSELLGWSKHTSHDGNLINISPYHFKYIGESIGTKYVISDGHILNINNINDKVTVSLKYKLDSGCSFAMKLYGITWINGQTSHQEVSNGEWTDIKFTLYPDRNLAHDNNRKLSFECTSQKTNWELEVKDMMVQYGENVEFYEFTNVNQLEDGRLEYDIPKCIPQNNYVMCITFNGYNMSTDYGNIITFNEAKNGSDSRNIHMTKANMDFDVNKDINIVCVRHDTYKKWYIQHNGVIEEVDSSRSENSRFSNWLMYTESTFGNKMNILTDGLHTHMVNSKLKNLYIGKFVGTEWELNGVLNKEYLFKVLMNNCYFDSMDIGESRLIQNSIIKTNDKCEFEVFPNMNLEIIDG